MPGPKRPLMRTAVPETADGDKPANARMPACLAARS